eukprot:COSAG04_NODE_5511_length_1590_cov_1.203219_1_plen_56_part_10
MQWTLNMDCQHAGAQPPGREGLKVAQNGWVAAAGDGSRLLTVGRTLLAVETGGYPP